VPLSRSPVRDITATPFPPVHQERSVLYIHPLPVSPVVIVLALQPAFQPLLRASETHQDHGLTPLYVSVSFQVLSLRGLCRLLLFFADQQPALLRLIGEVLRLKVLRLSYGP